MFQNFKTLKMKKNFLLLLTILSLSACGFEYRTHEFDTTVKVTDTNGKPQKDVSVRVGTCTNCGNNIEPSSFRTQKFGTTDSEGLVKFNYILQDDESSSDNAYFKIEDNASFFAISKAIHPVGSGNGKQKYTQSYNFLIDSARTYKLRVQKTAATVSMISFGVRKIYYTNGSYSTDSVPREFLNWSNMRAAFDSTFTFTAYAKMPFDIHGQKVQPKLVGRDSVFLIKF